MTSPTLDRRQGLVGNTPIKAPADCATTGSITLSGEQTIDGVTTSTSRVLVLSQADPTQNGLYDSSSAAWTRCLDADGNYDLTTGTLIHVAGGSFNGGALFKLTTAKPITIGTSLLTFTRLSVGDTFNVENFVVYGAADYFLAITAAITAASLVGGGDVMFGPGKTYPTSTPITLVSNVRLNLNSSTLQYTGASATAVGNSATAILANAGIRNGTIDTGSTNANCLAITSAYHCSFDNVVLKSNSATNIALDIEVNTAGTTNADGNRNSVFNQFNNILQDGVCGTALRMKGNSTAPTVCTLNSFLNFNSRGCSVKGIDFDSWCDSNYFAGVTRLQLVANNAQGVVFNSGTPASNVGVYSNNFDHLAVDTFGVMTGRVGFTMNWTKLNKIDYYFNDPPAEGGAYSFSANCQSYDVTHQVGLTSNLIRRLKLEYFGGKDNPIILLGGGSEITTETVGLEVGLGRTGNGFAYVDLIGDTTFTNYGLRAIRNGAGSSQLLHQGASQLEMKAQTAGGSVGLTTSTGSKVLCNDTGIGFLAAAPVAQSTGWGTPTGNAKVASFPGATATLAQTSAQLAQLIIDLKAFGLLGA